MGYVNNTRMSQFISPNLCAFSAGTWTPTLAGNVFSMNRTAADAAFNIFAPVLTPGNAAALSGAKLLSIEVYYSIGTAAADDFATVELEKMSLPASGTAVSGSSVSVSIDSGHDTAAERKATGDHTMTITLNSPAYIDNNDGYVLVLNIDAAATTVFKLYGVVVNYELRV